MVDRVQAQIPTWHHKVALITGASSGIGAATALELASRGLHVVLVARHQGRLDELSNQILGKGGLAQIITADLSEPGQRQEVFDQVVDTCGTPDVLINNAGLGWYGYYADMPWETAFTMLQVNIIAVLHLTRLFLPAMRLRGRGHIINIGSVSGSLPNQGIAIYGASKAFLDSFTTALYRELVGTPLNASVVRAGPVSSEFYQTAKLLPGGRSIPAERFAIPSEHVARCIWRLMQRPRRVLYVPSALFLAPWLEILFGRLIDRLGPMLLRRGNSQR